MYAWARYVVKTWRHNVSFDSYRLECLVLLCYLFTVRTLPKYLASLSLNFLFSKMGLIIHSL